MGGGSPADLMEQDGLRWGFQRPVSMIDGYGFDGAKAYKDSKLALMMTSEVLHAKYRRQTGIAFSSAFPGWVEGSPLFAGAPEVAYVGDERATLGRALDDKAAQDDDPAFLREAASPAAAGRRIFQVLHDPRCAKSGVCWSWSDRPRAGDAASESATGAPDSEADSESEVSSSWQRIFENCASDSVSDPEAGVALFKHASAVTGASWPKANQVVSPCPTLKVIGAVSKGQIRREELKRMREMPGFEEEARGVATKAKLAADAALGSALKNTAGRALGFVLRRLLGNQVDAAVQGSFQEEQELDAQREAELAAKLLGKDRAPGSAAAAYVPVEAAFDDIMAADGDDDDASTVAEAALQNTPGAAAAAAADKKMAV